MNIFFILEQIERGNQQLFDPAFNYKENSPFVLYQWLRNPTDNNPAKVIMLNEVVNPYFFSFLSDHPRLLLKLASAGYKDLGHSKYVFRNFMENERETSLLSLVSDYFECGIMEAKQLSTLLNEADIQQITEEMGIDKTDAKKLIKAGK